MSIGGTLLSVHSAYFLFNLFCRSVDVAWPTNPVALVNTALAGIELTQMMIDVACECNGHVVDRAEAWSVKFSAFFNQCVNVSMSLYLQIVKTDIFSLQ